MSPIYMWCGNMSTASAAEPPDIALSPIDWKPCYRIVPSRFPPISLFEDVADPTDLDAVYEIEAITNNRLREETGELALVPPEDRVSGPGTSALMAAFTHLNPAGSRFSDGSYGVFFAGRRVETAIEETKHHRTLFLQATAEPAQELDMRVYAADLAGDMHDIRSPTESLEPLYHPADYAMSQGFAGKLRAAGSNGFVYDSVRHPGGECVAVFRPRLLSNCRQERHLCYVWDGTAIMTVYEKKRLEL